MPHQNVHMQRLWRTRQLDHKPGRGAGDLSHAP
jgi:hypothetical protein